MTKDRAPLAFVILAALGATLAGQNADTRGDRGQVRHGKTIYAREGCAKCHYLAGKGGNVQHPLDGVGTKFTAEQIRNILASPRTVFPAHIPAEGMPSYGKLARADFGDLVAYVCSLKVLDMSPARFR